MNDKLKRLIAVIIFCAVTPVLFIMAPLPREFADNSGFSRTSIEIDSFIGPSGNFDTNGNTTDIEISGNLCYVADGSQGLRIYDISDPSNIATIGNLNTPSDAVCLDVNGDWAFIGTKGSGIRLINITRPNSPSEISFESTVSDCYDILVAGNYLYSAAGSDGLRIINITDIENPSEVGSLPSLTKSLALDVDGSLAYVADGSSGVRIIDITKKTAPVLLKTIDSAPLAYTNDLMLDGHLLHVADSFGYITIEVSNYNDPVIIFNSAIADGCTDVAFVNRYIYAVNEVNTTVFNLVSTNNIEKLNYNISGGFKICLDGGVAAIADETDGFIITQLSDFYSFSTDFYPSVSFGVLGEATDIELRGELAYVSALRTGLRIINISEIPRDTSFKYNAEIEQMSTIVFNKSEVGYWKGIYDLTDIEIAGNIAYVTSEGYGLRCVNISDPANPVEIGSFQTTIYGDMENEFDFLRLDGDVAYLVADELFKIPSLLSVNISDPTNPQLLDRVNISSTDLRRIDGLYLQNDYLFVADSDVTWGNPSMNGTIRVFDISNPKSISEVTAYVKYNVFGDGFAMYGDYAYYVYTDDATFLPYLDVVNFSNPLNPQNVFTQSLETIFPLEYFMEFREMAATDSYLFMGTGMYITVLDVSDPSAVTYEQATLGYDMNSMKIVGDQLYYVEEQKFTMVRIMNGGMDDVDGDSLGYLEELALGTSFTKSDTDGDGLNDSIEVYYGFKPDVGSAKVLDSDNDQLTDYDEIITHKTNPTIPDMDNDGYADGSEVTFGSDPQDASRTPPVVYAYLMIGIGIATAIVAVISIISFIKAFKKPFNLRVFMSHAPVDYKRYNLDKLGKKLKSIPNAEHYKFNPDKPTPETVEASEIPKDRNVADIEENAEKKLEEKPKKKKKSEVRVVSKEDALKNSQVFFFLATDATLNSEEAKKHLEYARQNDLFIVPIKSESVEWSDMAKLELDRELGVEFKMETFDESSEEVLKFAKNFQEDLTKIRDGLEKNKISFINFMEREYDLSADMIYQITMHLVKDKSLAGAWTQDKKQFLNAKEIKRRMKKMKKIVKTNDLEVLADKIGIAEEYRPYMDYIAETVKFQGGLL